MTSLTNNNANLQHQTAAAAAAAAADLNSANDLKNSFLITHHHPNSAAADADEEVKVQVDAIISRQAKVAETSMHPHHFNDDDKATITIDEVESTAEDRTITDETRRRIEEDNDGADTMEEVPQEVSVEGAESDDENVAQEQEDANADDNHDVSIGGEVDGKDVGDTGDDGEQQEEEVDATVEDAGPEELGNELEQQQQQGELYEQDQVGDVEGGSEEQHAIEDLQDEGESQETTPTTELEEGQNIDNNNNNQPTTNKDWDPYHILHPKNNGNGSPSIGSSSSSSHSAIGAVVSLSFLAASSFFICICCLRYYSRRRRHPHNHYRYNNIYSSNYNNGNKVYSALHGSDDFFSDDVSYFEKDSDDEEYEDDDDDYDTLPMNYSHDSDDDVHNEISTRGGVRLEMRGRNVNGAMHESLTLDECNG